MNTERDTTKNVASMIIFIKIIEGCSDIGAIDRRQAVGFGVVESNVHGFVVVCIEYCRWHLH